MAIDTFLADEPGDARKTVAWFANSPPSGGRTAFVRRGFRVERCTGEQLQQRSYQAALAAVVFTQRADKPNQVVQALEVYAEALLNQDCRIFLLVSDGYPAVAVSKTIVRLDLPTAGLRTLVAKMGEQGQQGLGAEKLRVWSETREDPAFPHVRIYGDQNVPWHAIANVLMEHPPEAFPSYALELDESSLKLEYSDNDQLKRDGPVLLRRSFANCSDVHFDPMHEGQSGVLVYRARAQLAGGNLKRWPQPYFVKIGKREQIRTEYLNYTQSVRYFVPFHLGPHLVAERCCLGAHYGVIVGDYVDESESLGRCASDGRAAAAIACLFDRTLRSWYHSAEDGAWTDATLLNFLDKIPEVRRERARELGGDPDADELLRRLLETWRSSLAIALVGPVHGDLNAGNVRVRGTDAIVIDFLDHKQNGIPIYDAACLEASLLVDGFAGDTQGDLDWFKSVTGIYDRHNSLYKTLPHNPKNPSSWFYACVRQIRLYARQMERQENQYAGALALALLKKAQKSSRTSAEKEATAHRAEEFRRAAAYVFAERVLSAAFDPKARPAEPRAETAEAP